MRVDWESIADWERRESGVNWESGVEAGNRSGRCGVEKRGGIHDDGVSKDR